MNILRSFSLLLALVLFVAIPLSAGDLTGKVVDPDGRAVANASVRLFQRNTGTVNSTKSSSEGSFSFKGVAPGDYILEGDAADAALTGSKEISITGNRAEDLNLKISGRSTGVLVTANSIPLSAQETGKAIDVIDSTDLALRDEFSIAEALRVLPGVQVQTLEGPGSLTEVRTRGMRPEDTALLVDGMRFHDAASIKNDATGFLADVIAVDTDRIEFLRGSASSLYGSNALGGVINVTSNTGGSPTHGGMRVEGGGLGLIRGVGNLGGGFLSDKLTYSGAISHLYMTKGVRDGLPFRNNSLQGMSRYSLAPGISITGRAWYSSSYLNSTESPAFTSAVLANSNPTGEVRAIALPIEELKKYEAGQPFNAGNATFIPNTIDPDGRKAGDYVSAIALFQHQVSRSTSYRVAYQAVDTRRKYMDGPAGTYPFDPGPGSLDNFNGYIDTLQARLDQQAGKHNLITAGYEFDSERYLSFDGADNKSPSAGRIDLRQRSHALYVQDQIRLLDSRLQLTAAGRTQVFDLRSPELQGFTNPYSRVIGTLSVPTAYTGDGALAYFLSPTRTKIRAHVGNSFRAPSGYERFGGGFGSYYGDPRLAPERSVSIDGGIDQWLWKSRLELNATAFYTNLQQIIRFANSFAPGADPFGRTFGGYINAGGGIARGMEFSGRFSPTANTKVQASYTYVNSDSRNPTISGTSYYKVLDLSPHTFTITVTQWIARRTNITFDMAAQSDYTMSLFGGGARQFRFNGPVKGDVMLRHDIPFEDDYRLEIYGKVENVFGQLPYIDGFIGPKAWFITGARVRF